MSTPSTAAFDTGVKARHRALWVSGDYPAVADVIAALGERLVEATAIGSGDRVLDVAAGAGNVAVPAARTGAHVVASDLTPELLETGRTRHPDLGIIWRTADAEDLPFDDDSFDVVTSCVGVMFTPDHLRSARELVRVSRPGGRIGLINWTPAGFIGRLFAVMKPYAPPLPPGTQPGIRWGDPDYIATLFGDKADLESHAESLTVSAFADGAAFRDFFKAAYGPTVTAYRRIADDAEQVAALDAAMAGLADEAIVDGTMEWEYLITTATAR
ncbi:methyltransferase domain-containing protein [Gordonia desulfuricans]|uniref:Methyltransferase domain-containing protein n=1 Tax=Gordonia desulfuricans TaxID=89051 RepID=A0A7K3LPB4_9ACTN|nr:MULTISPECIES: class I SAM-dependent methyltransferase [Gordonia]EMP14356.2 hypothetical protein ISGA_85 [Gordonia sp. NB41Y]NDK90073.1 methyltransferase domain-containing protein [Gordonia desulfuricans]WLP92170.1 class I SAM-dependent methyltransferase [Gordonia sp. NB41Y]